MSPSTTRAFAARLAEDDAFRALVADDPASALAEYEIELPDFVPGDVVLPEKSALVALGFDKKPPPPSPKPPKPAPRPINVQLFDPA
jgi:hypothetical protein